MASLNGLCTRFINVASAAFEIFRGLRSEPAARQPPIVRTSSTKRRINLEVEVTSLNQSAPRAPPKRVQFVDNAFRPSGGRSSAGQQHRAARTRRRKKFRQNPPGRRSSSLVNTPDDRKRNGITYGGAGSYGAVMAAWYSDGSCLVNGDSAGERIIMFVRHAPMRYGANWFRRRVRHTPDARKRKYRIHK